MLKQWICNPSVADLDVEEKYVTWAETVRSDRYVTVWCLVSVLEQLIILFDYALLAVR